MDFDWKSLVGTVAPTIATALGGPVAGLAVKALSSAILGKDDGDQTEIAAALKGATPETMLALKKADQDFAARMKELDIDVYKLDAQDRDSARSMQRDTRSPVPPAIAVLVFVGFFGILGALMFVALPPESADPLKIMLGALGALVGQIANFFFGSSSDSRKKTDLMSQSIAAPK